MTGSIFKVKFAFFPLIFVWWGDFERDVIVNTLKKKDGDNFMSVSKTLELFLKNIS